MWEKEKAAPGIGNWTDTFKSSVLLGTSHGVCHYKTEQSDTAPTSDKITLILLKGDNRQSHFTTLFKHRQKQGYFLLFQLVQLLLLDQLQI